MAFIFWISSFRRPIVSMRASRTISTGCRGCIVTGAKVGFIGSSLSPPGRTFICSRRKLTSWFRSLMIFFSASPMSFSERYLVVEMMASTWSFPSVPFFLRKAGQTGLTLPVEFLFQGCLYNFLETHLGNGFMEGVYERNTAEDKYCCKVDDPLAEG